MNKNRHAVNISGAAFAVFRTNETVTVLPVGDDATVSAILLSDGIAGYARTHSDDLLDDFEPLNPSSVKQAM